MSLRAGFVFFGVVAGCSGGEGGPAEPEGSGTGGQSSGGAGLGGAGTGGRSSTPAMTGGSGGVSATGGSTVGGAASGGAPGASGGSSGGTAADGSGGGSPASGGSSVGGGGSGSGGSPVVAGSAGLGGGGLGGSAGGGAGSGGSDASSAGAPGFSPCPAAAACAVLPLGDSITEGFGSSGGGYRVELFRRALADDKAITFVGALKNGPNEVDGAAFPRSHEGHGGYTIDSGGGHTGISGQITSDALSAYSPHIVLVMIGTNDINGNVDVAAAPTRLGRLLDDITTRTPNALVVVATIIPVANNAGTNQEVKTYNAALPGLVSSRAAAGKHVVLLDNNAAFIADANYEKSLMGDSLHPNDAGYAVLGRAFYSTIGPLLASNP